MPFWRDTKTSITMMLKELLLLLRGLSLLLLLLMETTLGESDGYVVRGLISSAVLHMMALILLEVTFNGTFDMS